MTERKNRNRKPMPMRRLGRQWAIQYLYRQDLGGTQDLSSQEDLFWQQVTESHPDLTDKEVKKIQHHAEFLITGVQPNIEVYDKLIQETAKNWDLDRIATIDRNILRLAIFEIRSLEDVPSAVAIDEALELSKILGEGEESRSFINGILDRIANQSS